MAGRPGKKVAMPPVQGWHLVVHLQMQPMRDELEKQSISFYMDAISHAKIKFFFGIEETDPQGKIILGSCSWLFGRCIV